MKRLILIILAVFVINAFADNIFDLYNGNSSSPNSGGTGQAGRGGHGR